MFCAARLPVYIVCGSVSFVWKKKKKEEKEKKCICERVISKQEYDWKSWVLRNFKQSMMEVLSGSEHWSSQKRKIKGTHVANR